MYRDGRTNVKRNHNATNNITNANVGDLVASNVRTTMRVGVVIIGALPYRADLWRQHSAIIGASRTFLRKRHSRRLTTTYLDEEVMYGRNAREKKVDWR